MQAFNQNHSETETRNLYSEKKEIADHLKKILADWLQSCMQGDAGKDYH